MDDELQVVTGRGVELTGSEHTFEHDDRMRDASGSQAERFLDPRDAERVRIRERTRCRDETVTVSVGFDCCDDARRGSKAANDREIVAQGARVDRDDRTAAHESP